MKATKRTGFVALVVGLSIIVLGGTYVASTTTPLCEFCPYEVSSTCPPCPDSPYVIPTYLLGLVVVSVGAFWIYTKGGGTEYKIMILARRAADN